jgi:hypothetical protein
LVIQCQRHHWEHLEEKKEVEVEEVGVFWKLLGFKVSAGRVLTQAETVVDTLISNRVGATSKLYCVLGSRTILNKTATSFANKIFFF